MFGLGRLDDIWMQRSTTCRNSKFGNRRFRKGEDWQKWDDCFAKAVEMGHENNLMGLPPDQSKFLGHSVVNLMNPLWWLKALTASPNRRNNGSQQKVVYEEGSIGTEDTWIRTSDGIVNISMGDSA